MVPQHLSYINVSRVNNFRPKLCFQIGYVLQATVATEILRQNAMHQMHHWLGVSNSLGL